MKLEGSLDAFSLPDVFQLLGYTKKTGGLHLVGEGSDGVVFFAAGQVTGASADGSRQPLARRLIGRGLVDDETLAAAVASATDGDGVGIIRALLEADAVATDLVNEAATEQVVDAIFDLLRWKAGDFAFVVDEANPDDVGVVLSGESVLADAEGRRSAWETVSQVVPSPQTVLAMPVMLEETPEVSREEWVLLSLVDGTRAVAELVDLTGSGQYAVVSTLAALVQRGLLEVRSEGEEDPAADDHVAVVQRRQQLLAPLEAFTPVAAPPAEESAAAPAMAAGGAARSTSVAPPASRTPANAPTRTAQPQRATAAGASPAPMLGGAHVPADVVPPRPEPFLPRRQADFDETVAEPASPVSSRPVPAQATTSGGMGDVVGATVTAPDPEATTMIERDPSINRSLMLRLIAGVRGL